MPYKQHKTSETIFRKTLMNINYFWPVQIPMKGRGSWVILQSTTRGGSDALSSLFMLYNCKWSWWFFNLDKKIKNPDVLLDGLQDRLPVFCSLESDLFPDDVSVLPLHLGARLRLGLDAQKLILVPQVHLMFYCGCGRKATRGDTLGLAESTHGWQAALVSLLSCIPFLMASCFLTDSSCLRRFSSFKTCC